MRKLTFTVGADSVSPESIQYGGIQGEHNATEIEIALAADIREKLSLAAESGAVYLRIDAQDGAGAHFIGQANEYDGEETVTYSLPQSVTAAGGNVELRLIFSVLADGEIEKALYSYAIKLRLDSSFYGDEAEASAARDISAIVVQAEKYALAAEMARDAAGQSALSAKGASDAASGSAQSAADYAEQVGQVLSDIETVFASKVDKSQVVSELTGPDQIPNGTAAVSLFNEMIIRSGVSSAAQQSLSDDEKALACSNIGAVSTGDVVSNCVSDGKLLSDKIPNAYAMYEFLKSYAVVANVTQSLSDEKKARARENIGAVGKDTYELIESIVTTEECQQVTRTAEPDGTAYAFTKCLIRVVIPATTAAATVSMNISTSGGAWLAGYYKSSATRTNGTTNYLLEAYQSDGIWKDRSDCGNTYSSATMTVKNISDASYATIGKVVVSLSTAGVNLPVGTKIEIYGVRA